MKWEEAKKHLDTCIAAYKELVGMPQVFSGFGIMLLEGLLARYTEGERTQELYDEIMSFKL